MQKISILYDASQAVLSTFDLDEVLQQILTIARDYFHLQNVAILLRDKDELYVRCQVGWDEGHDKVRFPIGTGITGTAAHQKRPVYAADVTKDARYIQSSKNTRSELAVPLMVRDDVVGVLDCQSENLNHFDSETIDLLALFSTQASMALQNARLYSLERQRASQLEAINAIAQQMTAVLDLKELLSQVCMRIQHAFQLCHVSVLLKDEEELVLRASHGNLTGRAPEGGRLPEDAGLWQRALSAGKTLIENDTKAASDLALYVETGSSMCIPLVSFGQTLGVLVLDTSRTGAFNPTDTQPLRVSSRHLRDGYPECSLCRTGKTVGLSGRAYWNFNRRIFRVEDRRGNRARRALRHGDGCSHGGHRPIQAPERRIRAPVGRRGAAASVLHFPPAITEDRCSVPLRRGRVRHSALSNQRGSRFGSRGKTAEVR